MQKLIQAVVEARISLGHQRTPDNVRRLDEALENLNRMRVQRGMQPCQNRRGIQVIHAGTVEGHSRGA